MAKNKQNSHQQNQQNHQSTQVQRDIFFNVLFYCLLIIVSPIVTFFGSKHLVFDLFFEQITSNIWAAISAVVTLHLALGLFLYKAYFSDEKPTKRATKQD